MVNLNDPEVAMRQNEEKRELMLLEAAELIKMAMAQRAVDQAKVERAVNDASRKRDHGERIYTFVVDYGQNMKLPKGAARLHLLFPPIECV